MNVSEHSVHDARAVRDYGAPNVQTGVERGEVSVSAARQVARAVPKAAQETGSAADVRRAAKGGALGGQAVG